ncbi:hypothetical protein B0H63DRAFT_507260 [Podospora didyma]|uniref:Uncharacterized protein n=1 Tax=Podospora didyma TaxID=330526 RepID=A0AAE0NXX4_9PEZI|nr:hypothetical protein B0H63DRAFT_507260 [Podospora didyma]
MQLSHVVIAATALINGAMGFPKATRGAVVARGYDTLPASTPTATIKARTDDPRFIPSTWASFDNLGDESPIKDPSKSNQASIPSTRRLMSMSLSLLAATSHFIRLHTFPSYNNQGSCRNPLKGNNGGNLTPDPSFAPCRGLAFTYAKDSSNGGNGRCQPGTMTCNVLPNGSQ